MSHILTSKALTETDNYSLANGDELATGVIQPLSMDRQGNVRIDSGEFLVSDINVYASGTGTFQNIISAPGAGKKIRVYGLWINCFVTEWAEGSAVQDRSMVEFGDNNQAFKFQTIHEGNTGQFNGTLTENIYNRFAPVQLALQHGYFECGENLPFGIIENTSYFTPTLIYNWVVSVYYRVVSA